MDDFDGIPWDYIPEMSERERRDFMDFCHEYNIDPLDEDALLLYGEACEYSDTLRTLPYR